MLFNEGESWLGEGSRSQGGLMCVHGVGEGQ